MTGSPADRREILAAARLPYQGVTLRFRRGSCMPCNNPISGTEKGEIAGRKPVDVGIT